MSISKVNEDADYVYLVETEGYNGVRWNLKYDKKLKDVSVVSQEATNEKSWIENWNATKLEPKLRELGLVT